jgi:lipopolysaccharide/colanic/teichoic acid biosynthesis glycosyltransferase
MSEPVSRFARIPGECKPARGVSMRGWRHWLLVLAPVVVVLTLGLLHAHLVGHYVFTGTRRFAWTGGYIVVLEFSAYLSGILDDQRSAASALWAGAGAAFGGAIIISLLQLAVGSLLLPREVVGGAAIILFPIDSLVALSALRSQRRGEGTDRVLVVLAPDEAASLEADLRRVPERPAEIVEVLPIEQAASDGRLAGAHLIESANANRATVAVLGRDAQADEAVVAQAAQLHGRGVRIRTLAVFYDEWLGKLPVADLERVSLMFDIQELHAPTYARMKRVIDLVSAVVGLAVTLVVAPVVWVADRFGNPGPLFFRQVRVGKGGRPFTMFKFRTMPVGNAESEWTQVADPRLRPVGAFMRRFHLDELPQSLNILRGELSLVGPRPEQPRYVAELSDKIPFYDVRHLVLPGVTGWAQVKFHYGASVEDALEKLQYEFFYLRHQGPVLDALILARTVKSMVRAKGR